MTTKTKDFTKEHALFGAFDVPHEIPNFLHQGRKATFTTISDNLKDKIQKFFWRQRLMINRSRLCMAYSENLIRRSQEIARLKHDWMSDTLTISMMIEIVRIIRFGLMEKIPDLKPAILEAFDNLPLKTLVASKQTLGMMYFPEMQSSTSEEAFAKFVANLMTIHSLSEDRKDRIQQVLRNRRDRKIFHDYAFDRLRSSKGLDKIQKTTEYVHDGLTKAVLEVLKPKEDRVGTYDIPKLLDFLYNTLNDKAYNALEAELVGGEKTDSLNSFVGFEAIFKMYLKYLGEPEREYTY